MCLGLEHSLTTLYRTPLYRILAVPDARKRRPPANLTAITDNSNLGGFVITETLFYMSVIARVDCRRFLGVTLAKNLSLPKYTPPPFTVRDRSDQNSGGCSRRNIKSGAKFAGQRSERTKW